MHIIYIATPVAAWFLAGSLKFLVNTIRGGHLAWNQIGYGGLPSTHSTIVSATAVLVGIKEGLSAPSFCIALTLALIIILDALSLRRQIGEHARALNELTGQQLGRVVLRERIGHRPAEVITGILLGSACALLLNAALG